MNNVDSRKGISDTDHIKDEDDNKLIYKSRGLTGLQNLGNTCFMNAALQALSNCPQLTQYMLVHGPNLVKGDLAKSYARLIKEMWDPDKPTLVVPNYVLQSIREACPFFKGYRQQEDVQEFLRCFLGQLHDEVKEVIDVDDIKSDKNVKQFVLGKDGNDESDDDENKNVENDDDNTVNKECDDEQEQSVEDEERQAKDKKERKKHKEEEEKDDKEIDKLYREREGYFRSLESRAYIIDQSQDKLQNINSPIFKRVKLKSKRVNLKHENESKQKQKRAKKTSTRYRSIISDLFDGKILSSVQCRTCDNISTTIEIFQDLSLPIPNKDHLNLLKMTNLQSIKGDTACEKQSSSTNALKTGTGYSNRFFSTLSQITNIFKSIPLIHNLFWTWLDWIFSLILGPSATLQDCLFAFFSTDELKGDDMYHCDKCKKLRNGVKLSQVLLLPEILCIHLKRFRHERMHPSKISNHVTFPLTGLDMSPFMVNKAKTSIHACSNQDEKEEEGEEEEENENEEEEAEEKKKEKTRTVYDLLSVICHNGSPSDGHYTIYALNSSDNLWYEFNDQDVTTVDVQTVTSCEAYVLFYRKI